MLWVHSALILWTQSHLSGCPPCRYHDLLLGGKVMVSERASLYCLPLLSHNTVHSRLSSASSVAIAVGAMANKEERYEDLFSTSFPALHEADHPRSNAYASPIVKLRVLSNAEPLQYAHIHIHKAFLTSRPSLANWFEECHKIIDGNLVLPMSEWSLLVAQDIVHWLYTGKLSFDFTMDDLRSNGQEFGNDLIARLAASFSAAIQWDIDDLAAYTIGKLETILHSGDLAWSVPEIL